MKWLIDRLKEPSTWQGIATFAGAIGILLSPELWLQIGVAAGAIIGLVQVIKKERETPPE
jgi:hypothetical protein